MSVRGRRFELDLDADNFTFNVDERDNDENQDIDVINDIKERPTTSVPSAPTLKSKSGFPEHRPKRISAFRRRQDAQRTQNQAAVSEPSDQAILHHIAQKNGVDLKTAKEKRDIDMENQRRIDDMSIDDIEEARAEIMSHFSPETLKRFMQRARIDEDEDQHSLQNEHSTEISKSSSSPTLVTNTSQEQPKIVTSPIPEETVSSLPPAANPKPSTSGNGPTTILESRHPQLHFPTPPRDPSTFIALDPTSPNFNTDLKEKYFPDLPHDPSTLSWMQSTSPDPSTIPYHPTSDRGYPPSQIRFSFTGTLIAPSTSQSLPPDLGLHHHGNAPDAAGYTVPELALLARSTVPGQRCIAYQTLGRILYRLGKGEFGQRGSDLYEGLWGVIENERVVEVMLNEAGKEEGKGHASARAYAVEAVWLWRRGGGGDRGILKEGQARAQ